MQWAQSRTIILRIFYVYRIKSGRQTKMLAVDAILFAQISCYGNLRPWYPWTRDSNTDKNSYAIPHTQLLYINYSLASHFFLLYRLPICYFKVIIKLHVDISSKRYFEHDYALATSIGIIVILHKTIITELRKYINSNITKGALIATFSLPFILTEPLITVSLTTELGDYFCFQPQFIRVLKLQCKVMFVFNCKSFWKFYILFIALYRDLEKRKVIVVFSHCIITHVVKFLPQIRISDKQGSWFIIKWLMSAGNIL
jgi:hypothetical protein